MSLAKTAYTGDQLVSPTGGTNDLLAGLLSRLRRDPEDLTMAVAADRELTISVSVLRVRGIKADRLLDAYTAAVKASYPDASVNETVMGGKTVFDVDTGARSTTFVRGYGDVLFMVASEDFALVDEAFFGIP